MALELIPAGDGGPNISFTPSISVRGQCMRPLPGPGGLYFITQRGHRKADDLHSAQGAFALKLFFEVTSISAIYFRRNLVI